MQGPFPALLFVPIPLKELSFGETLSGYLKTIYSNLPTTRRKSELLLNFKDNKLKDLALKIISDDQKDHDEAIEIIFSKSYYLMQA